MYKSTSIPLILALTLATACAQAEPRSADASPEPTSAPAPATDNLALPQPGKPVCASCSSSLTTASMIINSEYIGEIDAARFIEETNTGTTTHYFSSEVVDDLNDPATTETVVMITMPDIIRGTLVFTIDETEYWESAPLE